MPFHNNLNILKLDTQEGIDMAYEEKIYEYYSSIEHEMSWVGNYGARGEKRNPKRKATKEEIAKQNQRNREKYVRRLVKENFSPGDLLSTLKYPQGSRPTIERVEKDMRNFLQCMRRAYKKAGTELKYIYRIEIGSKGGVHIHIITNRLPNGNTDLLIQEKWKHGRVNYQTIYEQGGYAALASYMVKGYGEDQYEQLSLFPEKEQKKLKKYVPSRNLKKPKPKIKKFKRRTMRKVLTEGPKPTKGFYIDKDSIYKGVNPYTGRSYYHYIEYRIKDGRKKK